jgi:xylan 1,4-beta-xylosidase
MPFLLFSDGIFDDDMSVVVNPGQYWFFNVDAVYDYFLSIGIRPIVELSFMPELLASGNATIFWYKGNITPPRNISEWENLLEAFLDHLIDRYGIDEVAEWYFEGSSSPFCSFLILTSYFRLFFSLERAQLRFLYASCAFSIVSSYLFFAAASFNC